MSRYVANTRLRLPIQFAAYEGNKYLFLSIARGGEGEGYITHIPQLFQRLGPILHTLRSSAIVLHSTSYPFIPFPDISVGLHYIPSCLPLLILSHFLILCTLTELANF